MHEIVNISRFLTAQIGVTLSKSDLKLRMPITLGAVPHKQRKASQREANAVETKQPPQIAHSDSVNKPESPAVDDPETNSE